MKNIICFIVILIFNFSCVQQPEKSEKWIEKILLSEQDILMATSININSLLNKSGLINNSQESIQKKILINNFKSNFKSNLLGFNVDVPQKIFITSKKNNQNGAIFWIGEITSSFLFKETLKKYFDIEDISDSEINSLYIKDFNLYVYFNESNFIMGFSTEKEYVKSKLSSYFKEDNLVNSNSTISKFLVNSDDIGFYFSAKRINQLKNSLSNSLFNSQLTSLSKIDQFGNDFFAKLNFLNQKVSFDFTTSSPNQYYYNDNGVEAQFKKFIINNIKTVSFGFINFKLNQEKNLFTYSGFLDDYNDFLFFKLLNDQQLFSSLTGEMSFAVSDLTSIQTNINTDSILEDDFWEDDFDEPEISINKELPPVLISLGIKDTTVLITQLKKINTEFITNEPFLINDSYLLLFNNILHISNEKQLLSNIFSSKEVNNPPVINSQFFQNPLYAEIDLKLISNFLESNNLDQLSINQSDLFDKIVITGNNTNFSIKTELNTENENSLKSIVDLILKNKLLEPYL